MDIESLREYCLSFPGATECIQWEHDLLFKVGEKMFLVVGIEQPHGLSIKCKSATFEELIEREGCKPAAYLARYKWVGIHSLDVVPDRELRSLIDQSYQLVVAKLPKKLQNELSQQPHAA